MQADKELCVVNGHSRPLSVFRPPHPFQPLISMCTRHRTPQRCWIPSRRELSGPMPELQTPNPSHHQASHLLRPRSGSLQRSARMHPLVPRQLLPWLCDLGFGDSLRPQPSLKLSSRRFSLSLGGPCVAWRSRWCGCPFPIPALICRYLPAVWSVAAPSGHSSARRVSRRPECRPHPAHVWQPINLGWHR